MMKKTLYMLVFVAVSIVSKAQEDATIYQQAVKVVTNSPAFKALNADRYTLSKESISFLNQAYAFYLEDPDLKFIDYDFDNFFGDIYTPVDIKTFQSLRTKRRAKHVLFVSETVDNHFVIELLSFTRKKRSKYPRFYAGTSYSYLFRKEAEGTVTYLRTIKIVNQ